MKRTGEGQPLRFFLQGIIFLVIFFKIQCLGLGRNTLAGIVYKLTAFAICGYDALLNAKNLLIIYFCSTGTIAAGFCDLLPEQHRNSPFQPFFTLYTSLFGKATVFFNTTMDKRRIVVIAGRVGEKI